MKSDLHPTYQSMTVTCACGNSFVVGGTRQTLHVDVCSKCHPFFTGTQKFIDALGRVDKFIAKRKAASGFVRKNKRGIVEDTTPKSLKDMLEINKKKLEAQETAATKAE